jgi:uncharacterized iron-regulated membrane protein
MEDLAIIGYGLTLMCLGFLGVVTGMYIWCPKWREAIKQDWRK